MDVHSNAAAGAAVSGNPVDDFLPYETPEGGGGVSLEWLSNFVEDCLNGGFPAPTPAVPAHQPPARQPHAEAQQGPETAQAAPRAATKRRKASRAREPKESCSDTPPLLPQAYWLADSQPLSFPKREEGRGGGEEGQGGRRCTHCMSYKTPQWRAGPQGPKTLCNACGVRFKSGRLLPEYRPAKSPTFESFKHSNSHKKVMEMRMMSPLLPSDPSL